MVRSAKSIVLLLFIVVALISGCTQTGNRLGTVVIDSRPQGATVLVDGEAVGTTPLELRTVPAGVISGVLVRAGYEPERFEAVVQESDNVVITVELTPFIATMVREAGKLNRPEHPVQIHVTNAALTAAERTGMGPFPKMPSRLYWGSYSQTAEGFFHVFELEKALSVPMYEDFSSLSETDRVLGTLSTWIAPDGYWLVRRLHPNIAVVRFRYRGESPSDFVVYLQGSWRLAGDLPEDLDFDTVTAEDLWDYVQSRL